MAHPATVPSPESLYDTYVNPQWVRLLNLLQMNVRYERCEGVELFAADGRCYLDFLSGYCVHNTGHNHPRIVKALQEELGRNGPAMLQSHVPELAGELAAALCSRAGGRCRKYFSAAPASEGVEAAIKFARAHTGRNGLVAAHGAFHGLTCGALSLMDDPFWTDDSGRCFRASNSSRLAAWKTCGANWRPKQLRRSLSSPFKAKRASAFPLPII